MRYFLYAFKYWLAASLFMFVVIALMESNRALAAAFVGMLIGLFLVWRLIKAVPDIRRLAREARRHASWSSLFGSHKTVRREAPTELEQSRNP